MEPVEVMTVKYPELTANGFGEGDKINPDQVQTCIEWLLGHDALDRQESTNFSKSSYSWKHEVERDKGVYISNGAFICAALYLKYKMAWTHDHDLNVYFNIRSTSNKYED